MSLIVNNNYYFHSKYEGEILKQLSIIQKQNLKIMAITDDLKASVDKLTAKVDELQTAIDTDQASDAQVVSDLTSANDALKATVADLQAQLATVPDPTALQASIDSINATIAKVESASADVAGPDA